MRIIDLKKSSTSNPISKNIKYQEDDTPVSAQDLLEETCKELQLPKWAIFLRGLRYKENLTQEEFGKKVGVEQTDISQMERGLKPIGKKLAQKIAKEFKTHYRLFI